MAEEERNNVLLTEEVRELVALIKDTDIAELLIERGDAKLHIKRGFAQPVAPVAAPVYTTLLGAPAAVPAVAPGAAEPAPAPVTRGVTVTAPMVGTFYSASSPKEPPYVQLGDEDKPGDVLGIIEAMKIMNEIECEVHGRVSQILAQNSQAVEYGEPLMVIEPL
jgi:acetyl-CoA carboxylase biotin carboxyl carrier protein